MDCFYCIVSTAEDAVADLCVLDAGDDATALDRARAVAEGVPAGNGSASTPASG